MAVWLIKLAVKGAVFILPNVITMTKKKPKGAMFVNRWPLQVLNLLRV